MPIEIKEGICTPGNPNKTRSCSRSLVLSIKYSFSDGFHDNIGVRQRPYCRAETILSCKNVSLFLLYSMAAIQSPCNKKIYLENSVIPSRLM